MGSLVLGLVGTGIIQVTILFTYCKKKTSIRFCLISTDHYKEVQDTHITSNLAALLAADNWDVFMVQLVAKSLGLVPLLFVVFLKSHNVGTRFKKRLIQYVIYNQQIS